MGKAKRFNAYDDAVAEKRKLVQSYGLERQKLSGVGSTFRNMPLEPPNVSNSVLNTGTGDGKFITVSLAADQTTNLTATDHVEFDTIDSDGGIVLQTGSGQADGIFELESGKTYYLSAHLRPEFSGSAGFLVANWFDRTNSVALGSQGIWFPVTSAGHNADQPAANVIVKTTENITVDFRISSIGSITALANEYCQATIFEIALGGTGSGSGSGGGAGSGVTFPITPTINDHGNVGTTTEDIDLSLSTAHSHKITLTGNPTLTFSNPPSSGVQIEFEIEFVQDATGGRTITHPASVAETVNISSTASSVTIVTYRTNDGGTTYHAVPSLRGSISSSSNFLPLTGGTLTGNLVMSADITPSTTGTRDLGSPTLFWSDIFAGTLTVGDASDNYSLTGNPTGMLLNHSGGNFIINDGSTNNYTFETSGLTLAADVGISVEAPITFTEISKPASLTRHVIYAENTNDLVLNVESAAAGRDLRIDFDGTNAVEFGSAESHFNTTGGYATQWIRNDGTPSNGDDIGFLDFISNDSALNAQVFANITGVSKTVTSGSEAGALEFSVATTGSGALTKVLTLDNIGLIFESGFQLDMKGGKIDLDSDDDTSISASVDDVIQFEVAGVDALSVQTAGQLNWNLSGVGHRIDAGASSFAFTLGDVTDTFDFDNSDSTMSFVVSKTGGLSYLTTSDPADLTLNCQPGTPADAMEIQRIRFLGLSSTSTIREYAKMTVVSADVTNATEDGTFKLDMMAAGTLATTLTIDSSEMKLEGGRDFDLGPNEIHFTSTTQKIEGSASGLLLAAPTGDFIANEINNKAVIEMHEDEIGFFGATPVTQPTITGSRGGNAALASLLTAGANEGLWIDSTTA